MHIPTQLPNKTKIQNSGQVQYNCHSRKQFKYKFHTEFTSINPKSLHTALFISCTESISWNFNYHIHANQCRRSYNNARMYLWYIFRIHIYSICDLRIPSLKSLLTYLSDGRVYYITNKFYVLENKSVTESK